MNTAIVAFLLGVPIGYLIADWYTKKNKKKKEEKKKKSKRRKNKNFFY